MHSVGVGYYDSVDIIGGLASWNCYSAPRIRAVLTFSAQAGQKYFVDGKLGVAKDCKSVWIENLDTHEVIVMYGGACE